jgi:glutamate carboxypeptidase
MERAELAKKVMAWLSEREDEMLALLERLVAVNSHTPNKSGVDAVALIIEQAALGQGLIVERTPGEPYGDNLIARTPACGKGAARIMFCGHMDTVFPVASGFTEFRREENLAFGPGVIDMKGGLVVGLYALRALDALGLLADAPAAFVFNSDEEVGSPVSAELIRREAENSVFALVFECSGPGGETVTARKGKATYRLEITGGAGHAGAASGGKPSAILELAGKIAALEALNDPERGVSVNVGRVGGGSGPNVVAEAAEALVDTRFITDEDGDALARAVSALGRSSNTPGVTCYIEAVSARPAMERSEANRNLLEIARDCGDLLGVPVIEDFRGGVSDANLIARCGVPVLDGMGPAGEFDHSPDEYMIVSSLAERAALAALTAAEAWRRLAPDAAGPARPA